MQLKRLSLVQTARMERYNLKYPDMESDFGLVVNILLASLLRMTSRLLRFVQNAILLYSLNEKTEIAFGIFVSEKGAPTRRNHYNTFGFNKNLT